MTEDQIKAIAEEYACRQWGKPVSHTTSNLALVLEDFCKQLLARYCIVEREKVMEMFRDIEASSGYVEIPQLNEKIKVVTIDTLNRISIDLFGTSMFNQNEE